MRKFTKLLASLLVVMLLLGVVAVSSFAVADADKQLDLTDATAGIKVVDAYASTTKFTGFKKVAADMSDGGFVAGSSSGKPKARYPSVDGNKYASFYNDGSKNISVTGKSVYQDVNFPRAKLHTVGQSFM